MSILGAAFKPSTNACNQKPVHCLFPPHLYASARESPYSLAPMPYPLIRVGNQRAHFDRGQLSPTTQRLKLHDKEGKKYVRLQLTEKV